MIYLNGDEIRDRDDLGRTAAHELGHAVFDTRHGLSLAPAVAPFGRRVAGVISPRRALLIHSIRLLPSGPTAGNPAF